MSEGYRTDGPAAAELLVDDAQAITVLGDLVDRITSGQYRDIIGPDVPLLSSGIVDSLALVDLVEGISERFGVRLAEADLGYDTADTLRQLATLVADRRA